MRHIFIFQLFSVIKAVGAQALRLLETFIHIIAFLCITLTISLYSNKTVYNHTKPSNNKYILTIYVPRIDSYVKFQKNVNLKSAVLHRRYYLHFLFKVLNIGWSKGHLIKDCDNSSFCFSARQVCWLFLKLLCRQLTNYFCHEENNFK